MPSLHKKLLVLIIGLAIGMRLALSIAHPFHFPDSQDYDQLARAILGGKIYQTDAGLLASRMPGYPIFIAAIYALSKNSQLAVLIVQSYLSAFTIFLSYKIALRISPTVALIAALLAAFDPLSTAFTATLLSESLFTLTLLISLSLAIRIIEGGGEAPYKSWILLGAIWAVAVYLRASALWCILPITLICSAGSYEGSAKRAPFLGRVVVTLGVVLLALLPWQARNYSLFGSRFFRLTTLEGISLYEAVYPDATGGPKQDVIQLPPEMTLMNEAERNDEYSRRAWHYIVSDPVRILNLAITKVARTWSPTLNASDFQNSKLQIALAVWHIPLSIFALIGAITFGGGAGRMSNRIKWLLLTPVFYFTAVHALFLGSVRYRVPLMPLVCIFAAAGLSSLIKWVSRSKPTSSAAV